MHHVLEIGPIWMMATVVQKLARRQPRGAGKAMPTRAQAAPARTEQPPPLVRADQTTLARPVSVDSSNPCLEGGTR